MVKKASKRVQVETVGLDFRNRRRFYLGLIGLVLVVYSPSLLAGYHADDWSHSFIPREFSGFGDIFKPPFPFDTSFRPTFLAHLWVLSRISEASIPLARLWVILLHGLGSIVVFEIARNLFKGRELWIPLIAAAWFAVAFCHFEVPIALSNSETPAALFLLITVYLLLRNWPLKRPSEQALFIAVWLLALGAKEYALWIPFAWFAGHLFTAQKKRMTLVEWLGVGVPFAAFSIAYLLRFLSLDRNAEDLALVRDPSFSPEGVTHLISSIASLPLLDPAHPRWEGILQDSLGVPFILLAGGKILLFLAVLAAAAFVWRKGVRFPVYIGTALILCPLLLSCWLPGSPASRHTYLPSAGMGILFAGVLAQASSGKKRILSTGFILLLVLQSIGSFAVGRRLTQVTQERERITHRLEEALEEIDTGKRVLIDGLDPQLRGGMSLPFLFPDRNLDTLEPSPLLLTSPLEALRENPPTDEEAVVLKWQGERFERKAPSEFFTF
jgi:hypothetical protein